MNQKFKSGFVTLVGRPNVGKSSLLNRFVGQKLVITSDKPQTTRNQLRGISGGPDYQIVWTDTPGLHKPLHQLGSKMVEFAQNALADVDLALWLLDASKGFTAADHKVAGELGQVNQTLFAVWNKMDLVEPECELPTVPLATKVFKVSAETGEGIDELLQAVINELPEGPPFFPEDQLSDQQERFLVAEFIREQVLQFTEEEVPHSVAVKIEEMKERPGGKMLIQATIYVERDSQKGIVIGSGGQKLKEIGQAARKNIEEMLEQSVYLNLWVKVRHNWRNNKTALKEFGYWTDTTSEE